MMDWESKNQLTSKSFKLPNHHQTFGNKIRSIAVETLDGYVSVFPGSQSQKRTQREKAAERTRFIS